MPAYAFSRDAPDGLLSLSHQWPSIALQKLGYSVDGERELIFPGALRVSSLLHFQGIWIIDHTSIIYGVIIFSCFFVCAFTITVGPISWTYPTELV